jgi:hypothetical protein
MQNPFTAKIRKFAYGWTKECNPSQPVIACWDDNPSTDIVNAHNYTADFAGWDRQADMNPKKGAVFTEAGARWMAPRPSNGEPCEVIHWLNKRKAANQTIPGVYLCWELMAGNSNCRWYWGTPNDAPEPTVPCWTDYVLETAVMLKAEQGNAGVVFRVNQPGPGNDEMHGYYVGFDAKTLYLGKMQNNWQPLAAFDLSKLECRVVPGVWNLVRVAVEGKRIRVWFNRMHPSADKDKACGSTSPTTRDRCCRATSVCGPPASRHVSTMWWCSPRRF